MGCHVEGIVKGEHQHVAGKNGNVVPHQVLLQSRSRRQARLVDDFAHPSDDLQREQPITYREESIMLPGPNESAAVSPRSFLLTGGGSQKWFSNRAEDLLQPERPHLCQRVSMDGVVVVGAFKGMLAPLPHEPAKQWWAERERGKKQSQPAHSESAGNDTALLPTPASPAEKLTCLLRFTQKPGKKRTYFMGNQLHISRSQSDSRVCHNLGFDGSKPPRGAGLDEAVQHDIKQVCYLSQTTTTKPQRFVRLQTSVGSRGAFCSVDQHTAPRDPISWNNCAAYTPPV